MSNRRDDFAMNVRRALADRAAWICSNPSCGELTIGPSDLDAEKAVNTGAASHIHAAAPGGCRYDPGQTPEQRSNIQNGIWLCRNCATRVDHDCDAYSAATLKTWKEDHEAAVRNGGFSAQPLEVSLSTMPGLLMPSGPGPTTIRAADVQRFRQHELVVRNTSGRRLEGIWMRAQFPERILKPVRALSPAGTVATASPDSGGWVVQATGDASVTYAGPERPAMEYLFEISALLPRREVRFTLTSIEDRYRMTDDHEGNLVLFIEGRFSFEWGKLHRERTFLVPLTYDATERTVASAGMLHDPQGVRVIHRGTW